MDMFLMSKILMWTFCFLQDKTILLVPDFIYIRIYMTFSNTLVSLV